MAQVELKKYLFVGADVDRLSFFKNAQELGIIEFIDPQSRPLEERDDQAHLFLHAIKVLRSLPTLSQKEVSDFSKAEPLSKKIVNYREEIERLEEACRLDRLEESRVAIFGNFSMEDIKFIEEKTSKKIQFFCAKKNAEIEDTPELVKIASDGGLEYYFAINDAPKVYHGLAVIKIEATAQTYRNRIVENERKIDQLNDELKALACYNAFLHKALYRRMDQVHLGLTQERATKFEEGLFAVEGWVPLTKCEMLQSLCASKHIYYQEIALEETDRVPTYLENKGADRLGEDLVYVYDTPSTTDADPSRWVLWAFALFFGMIIGDAGYGLIFLGLSIFLYYRFPKAQGLAKRTIKLAIFLSTFCVIWGLLTTSFFGLNIALDNPLRKVSLVSWLVEKKTEFHIQEKDAVYQEWVKEYPALAKTQNAPEFLRNAAKPSENGSSFSFPMYEKFVDDILFELALFIGCLHIIFSLLRNIRRHWAGIGWVIFLIGSYLYFPTMLHSTSFSNFLFGIREQFAQTVGIEMVYGGIGLAILLGLIQKRWAGFLEIMTLIQIACDVLSYLRLYALGLAGMIMATTFNEIASMVGVFFGVFVILAGHLINMSLAIMSGVIHGLRLNFLEWYHYSFEGGGRLFKPLARLSKEN